MRKTRYACFVVLLAFGCADATGGTPFCENEDQCRVDCPFGFVLDASGCQECECLPSPAEGCGGPDDCVLAVNARDCCGCTSAFTKERMEVDICVHAPDESPSAACDVGSACDDAQCSCVPTNFVTCDDGVCIGLEECPPGSTQDGDVCRLFVF